MFTSICDFGIKINTVTRLEWGRSSHKVRPRQLNALVLRLKGNATFVFDNGTELTTGEGEVFYCPANTGYSVDYDDGEIIAIHFTAEGLSDVPEVTIPTLKSKAYALFSDALELWTQRKNGYYYKVLSILFDILAVCCLHDAPSIRENINYKRAAEYISKNVLSEISIGEVCRKFNISESGFRKYFSTFFGSTPIKYITDMRLMEAERLLSATNMSIENIAYKCGFSDVKYFSRVFSRHKGCPPSEFRYN